MKDIINTHILIGTVFVLSPILCINETRKQMSPEETRTVRMFLRWEMIDKFKALEHYEHVLESWTITISLFNLPAFNKSKSFAVYLERKAEPNTTNILAKLFEAKKRVYVPSYAFHGLEMIRVRTLKEVQKLREDRRGKTELSRRKREEALSNKGGLDMIIMPGIAFTRSGRRMGSGKCLMFDYVMKARRQGWPILVGLAYKHQVVEDFPPAAKDLKLDYVLDSVHADHFEDYEERLAKLEAKYKPLNESR
ncbi:unnamed protein product [Bemisia tabaci]|uniref:5-formyltetrahydrofolate cyclo-ligase n=1 Tax=Bemisia tabaci TaxID=7038 RepID=A0A9P0AHH4_BEMTA|nr:unnamed protein product [Bemisia tabaci]